MEILNALTIAAEGQKTDVAKPMKGLGSVFSRLPLHGAETPTEPSTPCNWGVTSGSVARFHLRDVPLCGSTEREMEERREDELQGEPLGARNDSVGGALVCGLSHCVSAA
jgi:hypothetical protein